MALSGWCSGEASVGGVRRAWGAVLAIRAVGGLVHHGRHHEARIGDAQTPDLADMLVRDLAIEDLVAHLEEDFASKERIGACLVGRADSLDLECLSDVLQAGLVFKLLQDLSTTRIARSKKTRVVELDGMLHQVLHIVRRGEVELHLVVKVDLVVREGRADEKFGEVTKVVAAVERDPSHVIETHEAGGD